MKEHPLYLIFYDTTVVSRVHLGLWHRFTVKGLELQFPILFWISQRMILQMNNFPWNISVLYQPNGVRVDAVRLAQLYFVLGEEDH